MTHKSATRAFPDVDTMLSMVGGRSHYNAKRKAAAEARRARLSRRLLKLSFHERGWQAELARQFKVHRSTISRDLSIIREESVKLKRLSVKEHENQRTLISNLLKTSLRE